MKGAFMYHWVRAGVYLAFLIAVPIHGHAQDKQTIHFTVTDQGLMTNDIKVEDKRFTLPPGVRVRLMFEYNDPNGNAHQFTVHSSEADYKAKPIRPEGPRTAVLEFTVGDRGEPFYRISCDLPCIAMEQLTDYLLFVGRSKQS
jgi:hypothetical protein